ncbi:hypothetical protein B0H13DRAFT_2302846 [Mycena leptocephala]|nr:hypothetical protein B0H13DRAFT_2302846 [Mycena leptocephala]
MSKTVTSHTLRIVTFSHIASRQANSKGTASGFTGGSSRATSKEELQSQVDSIVGPSGFLYFNEFNHGNWLQLYSSSPRVIVYVLGNPTIAQTMLQYDLRRGTGTDVLYHLPSSVMALNDDKMLKAAAEALDSKLEALVESITAVE